MGDDIKEVTIFAGIIVSVILLLGSMGLVYNSVEHNQQIECIEVGGSMMNGRCTVSSND